MDIVHYEVGRKLRDTLMGEARHGRAWFAPRNPNNPSRTVATPSSNQPVNPSIDLSNMSVRDILIKSFNRACVKSRCTLTGQAVHEDPQTELTLHAKLCNRQSYDHFVNQSTNQSTNQSILLKLAQLNSSYIVQLYDVRSCDQSIYALMEFCAGGELFQFLTANQANQQSHFTLKHAKIFFVQLLCGLSALHSLRIAHRDLSLENLLLTEDLHLRIADFGLAWEMPASQTVNQSSNQSIKALMQGAVISDRIAVGKIRYMSPEIFSCHPYNPFAGDMWACGVILFVLLNQCFPFNFPHAKDTLFVLICSGRINDVVRNWGKTPFDEATIDIFSHLFCPEEKRWTIEDCLSSPFLHDTWREHEICRATKVNQFNPQSGNQSKQPSSGHHMRQPGDLSRNSSASSTTSNQSINQSLHTPGSDRPQTSPQSAPASFNQTNHSSAYSNHSSSSQSFTRVFNQSGSHAPQLDSVPNHGHQSINQSRDQSVDRSPFSLDESNVLRSLPSHCIDRSVQHLINQSGHQLVSIDDSVYRSIGSVNQSVNQSCHPSYHACSTNGLAINQSTSQPRQSLYPTPADLLLATRSKCPSPPVIERSND